MTPGPDAVDSRVERDMEDLRQRQADAAVARCLSELRWADEERQDGRDAAAALLPKVWAKRPLTNAVRIDTGAALAWLRQWDAALHEFRLVGRDGTQYQKTLADANRRCVLKAREEAREAA